MQELKIVASTKIWESKNPTNPDFPMWHPVGSNEYVIGYLELPDDIEPSIKVIGEYVTKFHHMLEGQTRPGSVEIFSGYEIYFKDGLTHNEAFQLQNGDTIDFPAEDVTLLTKQEES
jgi:hypothetical protein